MRLMIFCSIASRKIKVLLSEKGKSYIKQLERKKLFYSLCANQKVTLTDLPEAMHFWALKISLNFSAKN